MADILYIIIPILIYAFASIFYDQRWSAAREVHKCSNPIASYKRTSWMGFNHRYKQRRVLYRCLRIGFISKAQYLETVENYSSGPGWASCIFINGAWFDNVVSKIGFRFDCLSDKLIEIKLTYNNDRFYPIYNDKERINILEKDIESAVGKDWKDWVGIQTREYPKTDFLEVILFLTPQKSDLTEYENEWRFSTNQ